jgi:hypothetical protein
VKIPVTFIRGQARVDGTCLDLSNEGLLVEFPDEPPGEMSELVRFEITFSDQTRLLLTAEIARKVGCKMGLRLFGVAGDNLKSWQRQVAEIQRRVGGT